MIRNSIRNYRSFALVLPFGINLFDADVVSKDLKTVKEADLSVVKNETGWDRLQQLFVKDDFGRVAPEVHSIFQTACMSSFIGAMYGGIVNSRDTYMDFMKNNQASSFKSHVDAKRKLQDAVTLSFAKGAFKWGWRLTFFSTSYITISTGVATYRGKNGILEHLIAGTMAGTLYKFQEGPRAWIVGGGLGFVLGGLAGVFTVSLLKLTGMTMEEVRYWNYKWTSKRAESFNREFKKHLDREHLQLHEERNEKLGNTGLEVIDLEENVNTKVNSK